MLNSPLTKSRMHDLFVPNNLRWIRIALCRQRGRHAEMLVMWSELPRSPGHVFYDRLRALLIAAGFDRFLEQLCASHYAVVRGRPSLPTDRYFRRLLIGYFEGIDSERGLEWRCADSLSLREFLRLAERETVPDHSWLSRTRSRLRGSAYLFCIILPDAALLAIIAFADEHPIAVLAISFEADQFN